MSFEDDLSKFEQQVSNFRITSPETIQWSPLFKADSSKELEQRVKQIEQHFKDFNGAGSQGVSVSGNLEHGYAINAKVGVSDSGTSGTGPPPPTTGACCVDADCFVLSPDDCDGISGLYQGDDTECDPNPCAGACCAEDGSCNITTEIDCLGTYQGDGTDCDPNPCPPPLCCCGITNITVSADIAWTFDDGFGTTGTITAFIGPVDCSMTCTDNNPSIAFCIPDGVDITAICDPTCVDVPPGDGFCVVAGAVRAGISAIGCDVPGQINFSLGSSGDVFYCQDARWDTGGGLGTEVSIPCDALGSYDFLAEFDPGVGWRGSTTFHVTVS